MNDIDEQRIQLESRLKSVRAEYRAAAGRFAAGDVGEAEIVTAKAAVEGVKAQIEALDAFEAEQSTKAAQEVAVQRSKEEADRINCQVADAISLVDKYQVTYGAVENYIDLLAEQYAHLMSLHNQIPSAMRRMGPRASVRTSELLIMPQVLALMLGKRLAVRGLSLLGRSAPIMTGLQDKEETDRHKHEVMKAAENAKNYIATYFVHDDEAEMED